MRVWIVFLLAVLGGAPAMAQTLERQRESLAIFEQFAGEPVDQISNFTYTDWRPLGESHLALFRTAGKAWLVDLRSPCVGLDWAKTIAIRSATGTINARFDRVEFRDGLGPSARVERCIIDRIRPVDYAKVRDAEAQARKARKAAKDG
jgi:hypothetical protein